MSFTEYYYNLAYEKEFEKVSFNLDDARKATKALVGGGIVVRRPLGMDLRVLTGAVPDKNMMKVLKKDVPFSETSGKHINMGPLTIITLDKARFPSLANIAANIPKQLASKNPIFSSGDLAAGVSSKIPRINFKNPQEKEMFNRTLLNHEGIERQIIKKTKKKPANFYTHMGPEVIMQENNMLATMPESMRNVKDAFTALRNMDGSPAAIKSAIPGFEYGKQRYSRHAIKRMAQSMRERGLAGVPFEELEATLTKTMTPAPEAKKSLVQRMKEKFNRG